ILYQIDRCLEWKWGMISLSMREATSSDQRMVRLSELRSKLSILEQQIAQFEKQAKTRDRQQESPVEQSRSLLLPHVQNLEQSLLELVSRSSDLIKNDFPDVAAALRIYHLSMYCYLLVRNLMLVLRGTDLPVEYINMNTQITEVLDLLKHKVGER